MVSLTKALSQMSTKKILVIGDIILDLYTKGSVDRISPEAPVPIMLVREEISKPGGAANVALNLQSLGATVTIVGRIGDDSSGKIVQRDLSKYRLASVQLFVEKQSQTPTKKRLIASGQQLIRADYENVTPLSQSLETKIASVLLKEIPKQDAIAISDYAKGFLTDSLLSTIMKLAKKAGVPVIVDPKGKNLKKYRGAFVLKPNRKEAYEAAHLSLDSDIELVARKLLKDVNSKHLIITRSEEGMSLFNEQGVHQHFPVKIRDVLDVTGAGDTSLAMICFAIANQVDMTYAVELANIASSLAIERLGCHATGLSEIARYLLEVDPFSKVFDEKGSRLIFDRALEGNSVILLDLKGVSEMSTALFHKVQEIYQDKGEKHLAIYLEGEDRDSDFVRLLASMCEIDFVLLHQKWYNTLRDFSEELEVILVKELFTRASDHALA